MSSCSIWSLDVTASRTESVEMKRAFPFLYSTIANEASVYKLVEERFLGVTETVLLRSLFVVSASSQSTAKVTYMRRLAPERRKIYEL